MKGTKSAIVRTRMPPTLLAALRSAAATDGTCIAETVRAIVIRDLTARGFWPPRREGAR